MDEQQAIDAAEKLLGPATTGWTFAAAAILFLLVRYASRAVDAAALPRLSAIWQRLLPIVPETISVPVCLLGGLPNLSGMPWLVRLACGFWIAYLSSKTQKLIGQGILGDDPKIERLIQARQAPIILDPNNLLGANSQNSDKVENKK